ncbi:flagellar hook-associated protein FlgL [Selenomonas sp.]|jgi:flagellar hook-associated protein 3 FlgL|uniref:flagellar hook-associated protein FlgL n=1 Tax=Selenomonas sp. TaxID=2053611 RepID=UPI003A0FF867
MAIRVSSNQMVYNYKKQLNDANNRKDKLMEQGDGNKLHRPSDDSVAYTKYLRYDTSEQENEQYQKNVSTGISWMKASDAALVSMTDIQTTFKEKTVAAANGDKTNEDMAAIGKELEAEIQELVSLGNTQQGDRYLFAGQKDTTQPFSLSEKEVKRGLAKTLSEKASNYFSGTNGAETMGTVRQMLTLTGSDGNTYYLNTRDGHIYTKDFVEKGYQQKIAQDANAKVDPKDAVGLLTGWKGSTDVSTYFKNTGEIIDAVANENYPLSGKVSEKGMNFKFATIDQKIATYQGDNKYISMTKKNGTTEPTSDTVNVTGPEIWGTDIFDDASSGNAPSGTAMLNEMLTVQKQVVSADFSWLSDDGQTISDQAHATTVTTETKLGARQQLYNSVATMLDNQNVLIKQDVTDVSSVDVAALATKLMEEQTVYNMSLALGARILPQSLADYLS